MGTLIREGLHPDQQPDLPAGMWCAAAWSVWVDLMLRVDGPERLDALEQMWGELNTAGPSVQAAEPTMETWGTSDAAQAGAAGLMAMMGGAPPAAPRSGESASPDGGGG